MANIPFLNNAYFAAKVGIGTTNPTVSLQLGNSTLGQTGSAIFHSEGGGETGLTIQARTNRARLRVADNDSNAYVVAEAGKAQFGAQASLSVSNVTVLTSGNVGIGTTSPTEGRLVVESISGVVAAFGRDGTDGDVVQIYNGLAGTTKAMALGAIGNDGTIYSQFGDIILQPTAGNVGIGTTSPARKLDVAGDLGIASSVNALRIGGNGVLGVLNGLTRLSGTGGASGGIMFTPNNDNTERMRITSAGLVGIGTTSPQDLLSLSSVAATSRLSIINTDGGKTILQAGISGVSNNGTSFITANSNGASESVRMVISSSGSVGIGTTTPGSKFVVRDVAALEQRIIHTSNGTTVLRRDGAVSYLLSESGAPANRILAFGTQSSAGSAIAETMRIDSSGNVLVNKTSSTGDVFQVQGKDQVFASRLDGSTTTGQSYGLRVRAGTNSVDTSMLVENTSGTDLFEIKGTGNATFTGLVSGITPVAAANFVTKAYVDGSSGGTGPFLPLAGGTMTGNLKLNDNVNLYLGTGNDFQAYHDGSNTYLRNLNGNFIIKQDKVDADLILECDNGSGGTTRYLTLNGAVGSLDAAVELRFPDGIKAKFGSSQDLQIYHDGTQSYIDNTASNFNLRTTGGGIFFKNIAGGGNEHYAKFLSNAAVELYYDAVKKFETTSAGATVTGQLTVSNGIEMIAGNFNAGDNERIRLGNSADLQVYHDGTNSYLENNTGDLYIRSNFQDRDIILQSDDGGGGIATYIQIDGSITKTIASKDIHFDGAVGATFGSNASPNIVIRSGLVTATTFSGDLNGTINTATTAVTQADAIDNTTVATTAYVNNKIQLIPAGLIFQGTWNAATNTPTLTSGSGTTGHFYIVSVSGNTNLDGITDWKVGDWAVFIEQGASDQWEKIDNSSVLGGSGTGGTIAGWSGSGTSVTLSNSPVTFSGNNISIPGTVVINDTLFIAEYIQHIGNTSNNIRFTTDAIAISANATFAGDVTVNKAGSASNGSLNLVSSDSFIRINTTGGTADKRKWDIRTVSANGFEGLDFRTVNDANNAFSTKLSLAHNGNVGIGMTPRTVGSYKVLDLATTSTTLGPYIGFNNNSGSTNIAEIYADNAALTFVAIGNKYQSFYTNGSERMRINSNGNVAIGTTANAYRLQVEQNSTGLLSRFHNTNADGQGLLIRAGNVSSATRIIQLASENDTKVMTVNSDGKVGIGTINPGTKLVVSNGQKGLEMNPTGGTSDDPYIQSYNRSNNSYLNLSLYASGYYFSIGSSNAVTITNSRNVGIGTTVPGVKLTTRGTSGLPATSGSTQTNGALRIEDGSTSVLDFGVNGGSGAWLQATNSGSLGTVYNLLLQPNGGNVGIGTTNPTDKLFIRGSNPNIVLYSDTTTGSLINFIDQTYQSQIKGNQGTLVFNTGGTSERMRILANGNVGIGTTSPERILHLDANGGRPIIQIDKGGDKIFSVGTGTSANDDDNTILQMFDEGTEKIRLFTVGDSWLNGGNVGIGTTSPSSKLQVAGGIQMADDTATPSAAKVGTMRYRTGTEYVDVDGVELVVNGNFTSNTDWNLNSNWSISGGTCNADGTSNNDINQADALGVIGQSYRIVYIISAYTQGSISARIGNGGTDYNTGTGTFSQVVTATTTDRIRMNLGGSFIGSVDSLSIVKVTAEDASYADMCMQTGASTYEWVNIVRNTY